MHHGNVSSTIAKGLKELRRRIDKADIPSSKLDETITIATWNIREFGRRARKKASLHFIAEILGQFDLIAVTEVRRDVTQLSKVLKILGPYWRAVYSDFTPDPGGNKERVAYVYDTRSVAFTGLASEADAPRKKDKKTGEYLPEFSWWRTPYIASFSSGNFDFVLVTAHIRWGKSAKERAKPLELLAKWVETRRKDAKGTDPDIIVMGDFNIPKIGDPLFAAITSKGLRMPKALAGVPTSTLCKGKRYDQILHYPVEAKCFTDRGGVIDFYKGGIKRLYPGSTMDKGAFTYEISDHLPLWLQVDVDIDDEHLEQRIRMGR